MSTDKSSESPQKSAKQRPGTDSPGRQTQINEKDAFYRRVKLIQTVPIVLLFIYILLALGDKRLISTGHGALIGFHIILIPWLFICLPVILVSNIFLMKQALKLRTGRSLIVLGYICTFATYLVVYLSPEKWF